MNSVITESITSGKVMLTVLLGQNAYALKMSANSCQIMLSQDKRCVSISSCDRFLE